MDNTTQWIKKITRPVLYPLGLLFMMLLGWVLWKTYQADNLGFASKTFWDWMELFLIPLVLAVSGFWFAHSQKQAELEIAAKARKEDQKLAKTQLLHQLIIEFNKRYDGDLNNALACRQNLVKENGKPTTYLIDYFNLCAEEYLYYKLGYIPEDVWLSWCWGMWQFFDPKLDENKDIIQAWEVEEKTNSYYGFTIDAIKQGTGQASEDKPE